MKTIEKKKISQGITEHTPAKGKKFFKIYICKRAKINGILEKFERRLTCKSLGEANRSYSDLLQEIGAEIATKNGSGKEWRNLIIEWELFHQKKNYELISQSTIQDYSSLLKNWTYDWMKLPAKEISKQNVRTAIERVKKERSIKHTAKLKDAIKSVFQWAIDHDVINGLSETPTLGISVSRKTNRLTEVLTEEIAVKLLQSSKLSGHEWYYVWALALYTGMRNGELFALKWSNIDFSEKKIKVSEAYKARSNTFGCTKSGVERVIPINDSLLNILRELQPLTESTTFVLPRLKDWQGKRQALVLKTFCTSIGIKPIRFHTLRATFTTLLLSKGVGVNIVQAIGGWADISTMNHYSRMAGLTVKDATSHLELVH